MITQETFSTEGAARQQRLSSRPRVLLVEDERVSRRALSALLSASGYPTEAVGTAEEALQLLNGTPLPRIALVDLNLPGMSGLDLIERLEQLDPGVFAVLITAQGGERLLESLQNRRVAYMQKPINFDRLLMMLAEGQRLH
jgi:two-component system response regulator FlrC